MNRFEQLDNLISIAGEVKSINESKIDITDIPIDPNCETAEQARDYVRDYFKNMIDNDGGGGGGGRFVHPLRGRSEAICRKTGRQIFQEAQLGARPVTQLRSSPQPRRVPDYTGQRCGGSARLPGRCGGRAEAIAL